MAERKSVEETKVALHDVVREMYDRIVKGDPPTMTLPVRTKNNIGFDSKLGVYKYGKRNQSEMLQASVLQSNCFKASMSSNSLRI